MSNIYHLDIPFKSPLNSDLITDDLIDILYDFLPAKFSFWSLKLAQSRFNERQQSDAATWLDKMQVYVGLPDWVVTKEQMYAENVPHLKCPLGLVESLCDLTEYDMGVALTYKNQCKLTGLDYDVFYHVNCFDVIYQAVKLDGDILNSEGDFAHISDHFDRLITNELNHVKEKSDYLIKRMQNNKRYAENINILNTAIATCRQLSEGKKEVVESFIGIRGLSIKSLNDSKEIYSSMDIEDFYQWASEHFGLDDYYDDSEELIDHIKGIFRRDELFLNNNLDYQFMVKVIAKSEPCYRYLTE